MDGGHEPLVGGRRGAGRRSRRAGTAPSAPSRARRRTRRTAAAPGWRRPSPCPRRRPAPPRGSCRRCRRPRSRRRTRSRRPGGAPRVDPQPSPSSGSVPWARMRSRSSIIIRSARSPRVPSLPRVLDSTSAKYAVAAIVTTMPGPGLVHDDVVEQARRGDRRSGSAAPAATAAGRRPGSAGSSRPARTSHVGHVRGDDRDGDRDHGEHDRDPPVPGDELLPDLIGEPAARRAEASAGPGALREWVPELS